LIRYMLEANTTIEMSIITRKFTDSWNAAFLFIFLFIS